MRLQTDWVRIRPLPILPSSWLHTSTPRSCLCWWPVDLRHSKLRSMVYWTTQVWISHGRSWTTNKNHRNRCTSYRWVRVPSSSYIYRQDSQEVWFWRLYNQENSNGGQTEINAWHVLRPRPKQGIPLSFTYCVHAVSIHLHTVRHLLYNQRT